MEDGVAVNQKENARKLVVSSLKSENFGRAGFLFLVSIFIIVERLVRINAFGSGYEQEDLQKCIKEVAKLGVLDAIVVPKVEAVSHLKEISE